MVVVAKELIVSNPFNGEELVTIQMGSVEDVNEAYEKAQQAQEEWKKVPSSEKQQILLKAAALLEERRNEIVHILNAEAGSSHIKANSEITAAIDCIKESASLPFRVQHSIQPSKVSGKTNRIYRDPVGVIGVITPWNFPLSLSIRAVAPALALGNAVVLKPSLDTPISGGIFLAKVFEDAGLPEGLLSVIIASSSSIGDSFIENPIPRIISFTGSTEAGRHIAATAGRCLKKVSLELGGNNAFIVLDDADLEKAVEAAIFGKFLNQGQICMAINRIIVDQKVYEPFKQAFFEKAKGLTVGDPSDPNIVMGPLINEKQVKSIQTLVEQGIEAGANLLLEGTVNGNLVSPFVFSEVRNDMNIAQSEIFGPIALLIPAENEEEAVKMANDTPYGLTGSVFSHSKERALDVAEKMKVGMFHINDQSVNSDFLLPFGGEKDSGIGRHGAEWAIEEYTTVKWVSIQEKLKDYPF